MPNKTIQFSIQLVDASDSKNVLKDLAVRVALLDNNSKETDVLFDSYADAKGVIRFSSSDDNLFDDEGIFDFISSAFSKKAEHPSAKLEVFGFDEPILTKIIKLNPKDKELTLKVDLTEYKKQLNQPFDKFLADTNIKLTANVGQFLKDEKVSDFAKLRDVQIPDKGLHKEDLEQIALLNHHAVLQLVSRDNQINQTLIEANYKDIFSIAHESEKSFVETFEGKLKEDAAQKIHLAAKAKLAVLNNIATEHRVFHYNGFKSQPNFAQAANTSSNTECECGCQSAVSPLAYLTDLLDYTFRHAKHNNSSITPEKLEELFYQPFKNLPVDCSSSDTLIRQVRLCIEVLRRCAASRGIVISQNITNDYLRKTFDGLLAEIGTSWNELRLVRGNTDEQKSLAERLGINLPESEIADKLNRLRMDLGSGTLTEENVELIFGLQDTSREPLSTGVKFNGNQNQIVRWRFSGVEFNFNTDENGKIYASLTKNGNRYELKLFRDSANANLIAEGIRNSAKGEIILEPKNESHLTGRVEIDYRANDQNINFALVPELLIWRLKNLRGIWLKQDEALNSPIINPDNLTTNWIRNDQNGDLILDFLENRKNELDYLFEKVKTNTDSYARLKNRLGRNHNISGNGNIIHHSLGFSDVELELALDSQGILPIDQQKFGITARESVVLSDILKLAKSNQTDAGDWENVHHILVNAEKRKYLFARWRDEENAQEISISPDYFRFPVGYGVQNAVPVHLTETGVRWRLDKGARNDWRDTLSGRIEQQNSAVTALQTAIETVEERNFPEYRNKIIETTINNGNSLAEKQNWVTNQLLINASEGGCRKTTRVAQAIETLQLLLWGLRTKNIEDINFSLSADNFDEEWRWLGAYGTWRTAMFVFLYPENVLLPRLRKVEDQSDFFQGIIKVFDGYTVTNSTETDSNTNSNATQSMAEMRAKSFAQALEGNSPTSAKGAAKLYQSFLIGTYYIRNSISANTEDGLYYVNVIRLEGAYYLPIQIGLVLQRAGDYITALDWFGRVYDFRKGELNQVVANLFARRNTSASYQRYDNWLQDPLNPHLIAETRADADQKFILISIIKCLIEYAESEFTADTSESLARARELYLTAERLLNNDLLNQTIKNCDDLIGEIFIKIGDDTWHPIIIEIARDILRFNPDRIGEFISRDRMLDDLEKVIDERNLTLGEKHRNIRRIMEEHLPPIVPEVSGQRMFSGIEMQKSEFSRLLQNKEVFQSVQKVQPRKLERNSKKFPPSPADGLVRVDSGIVDLGGGRLDIYIPAPKFKFCIPQNPLLKVLRMKIGTGLFKLQNCLNIAGMTREIPAYAAPTDTSTGLPSNNAPGQISLPPINQTGPTQYRYRTLVDQAKYLVGIAQQMEGSYLSFLEKADLERYNLLRAKQDLEVANSNFTLQDLRLTEANRHQELALLQEKKVEFIVDYYKELINEGLLQSEEAALFSLYAAATIQGIGIIIGAIAGGVAAFIPSGGTATLAGGGIGAALGAAASGSGVLMTTAQIFSTEASFERRRQEWQFQKDLAELHDKAIAQKQIELALDHIEIVTQEKEIARLGAENASDVVMFLNNKFTNVELYDWMITIVGGIYRYFLEQAAATAKVAQTQLAFERQEPEKGIISNDYWTITDQFGGVSGESALDRRGMTGSVRLLQDLTLLDRTAFLNDHRKHQLTKTISLARLDPIVFQRFRQTGILPFETTLRTFDRDFPGHYLRLIKRVRVSVIALIPPTEGIKATLSTRNLSKVVRSETFDKVDVIRLPESVALTSPINATGIFELVEQPEMLLPFEGLGVESSWEFRLPKFANSFDYNSIADVLLTIEYTSLEDFTYRQRVIEEMPATVSGERPFSLRQNFSDAWYDLNHPDLVEPPNQPMQVVFETVKADFPANLNDLGIQHISLYVARKDGNNFEIQIDDLSFAEINQAEISGGGTTTVNAISSTRNANGGNWSNLTGGNRKPFGKWRMSLPNTDVVKNRFKNDEIEDILFVITFSGRLVKDSDL